MAAEGPEVAAEGPEVAAEGPEVAADGPEAGGVDEAVEGLVIGTREAAVPSEAEGGLLGWPLLWRRKKPGGGEESGVANRRSPGMA